MSRVTKESFYEISAKFEEEFENAEVAAKADRPSEVAKLEVIDIKLQKAKITLNKGEKNESIKV
tara:strand:- start:855 stop:1046 length:192 start_codon:yes stop_codon:yes gene_type:complete